ncbi:MAG: pilus assembly protein N-terminal domain-containing protein [Rhodomicrobiaceae bacterium]
MTASLQRSLFVLVALASLSCEAMAHGDKLLNLPTGFAMTVKVAGAEKGKFTAIVGDPNIADVAFGPQNTFMFIGKKEGITNIIVLKNDDGTEIYTARLAVGGDANRVMIHNQKLLTSFTVYSCTPACEHIKEVASAAQALPAGYSSATFESNTNQPPPPATSQSNTSQP